MAVKGTRSIGKADMVLNDHAPLMEVDSQTYKVHADGILLICEPENVLPPAQRFFCFDVIVGMDERCTPYSTSRRSIYRSSV